MTLFEAGILTKMTENEYEKLVNSQNLLSESNDDTDTLNTASSENLKPLPIKVLQGAFYCLLFGICFGGNLQKVAKEIINILLRLKFKRQKLPKVH